MDEVLPNTSHEQSNERINRLLDSVCSLAPAAPVVPKLITALADANTDATVIAEMISFDSVLTAKLLRTCNSAFLAPGTPVTTVSQAVARLGFQATRRMVTVVLMVERLKSLPRSSCLDNERQWRHSVTTAFAAQFLAEDLGMEVGLLFTAGLVHDIGKLVLAAAFPETYATAIIAPPIHGTPLAERELSQLGISHAGAGARLLERWSLAPLLVGAVAGHHDPEHAGDARPFAACLEVADALAYAFSAGAKADDAPTGPWPASLTTLGLGEGVLPQYLARIEENLGFVEAFFGLHRGDRRAR